MEGLLNLVCNLFVIGMIFSLLFTFVALPWIHIIRSLAARRREQGEQKQRVHDAIAKITEDGKVEGPKGEYKPKRWGRRAIDRLAGVPSPRKHFRSTTEL